MEREKLLIFDSRNRGEKGVIISNDIVKPHVK